MPALSQDMLIYRNTKLRDVALNLAVVLEVHRAARIDLP
jgi:hypothetical protein